MMSCNIDESCNIEDYLKELLSEKDSTKQWVKMRLIYLKIDFVELGSEEIKQLKQALKNIKDKYKSKQGWHDPIFDEINAILVKVNLLEGG